MSATASTDREFEVGAVAHVTFRVRCEKFGFGEEVFLVSTDGKQVRVCLSRPSISVPCDLLSAVLRNKRANSLLKEEALFLFVIC